MLLVLLLLRLRDDDMTICFAVLCACSIEQCFVKYESYSFWYIVFHKHRSVAQLARALVSKTKGRGFESCRSCQMRSSSFRWRRNVCD